MTATLRLNSRSARQPTELVGAPFPPAPAHTRPNTALPPSPFDASGSFAELELPAPLLLAIPELGAFDQDELNDNPILNELCPIPLIGGLLIARRLITREQLDACLLLQSRMHPAPPIGQILVRNGYITQAALDQTLGIQAGLRSTLEDAAHAEGVPAAPVPQARQQH
jgi:hypothetical protein